MESWALTLVITFVLIIVLIGSGLWISIGVAVVGIIVVSLFTDRGLGMLGFIQFNAVNAFTFTPLPLFTFMGYMMLTSGLSRTLYRGANSWVGWLPGGLLHTNVASCSIFGAISGSSLATAATIGAVAFPELERRGYDRRLTLGSLAGSGTLGSMIPPSSAMIIYGAFVETSVSQLFMGGVFTGLLEAALYMLFIGVACVIRPSLAPQREKFSIKAAGRAIFDIFPIGILILMVLGTIYFGIATPTEAAAMGAVGALLFCAIYRKLTWGAVKAAGILAINLSSWVMLVVIGASIVSTGLGFLRVPASLVLWVSSLETSPIVIFAVVALMYILLGMVIDGYSMMFLTLPVVHPLMMSLGFNSVWFGVVMVIFIEMALITPPVGSNLYVIDGISGRKYLREIITGSIPFFLMNVVELALVYTFPAIVLWLPSKMIKKL
ncbi:MAG: TRAP transporter large permease [Chloroflexi bacterium]|nr:TRAP transporter large permease [Chloroflexota bacterium]